MHTIIRNIYNYIYIYRSLSTLNIPGVTRTGKVVFDWLIEIALTNHSNQRSVSHLTKPEGLFFLSDTKTFEFHEK